MIMHSDHVLNSGIVYNICLSGMSVGLYIYRLFNPPYLTPMVNRPRQKHGPQEVEGCEEGEEATKVVGSALVAAELPDGDQNIIELHRSSSSS